MEAQMMWMVHYDYDEFVDISILNPVFDHIPNYIARRYKTQNFEHYCIDTKLNHYVVYHENNIVI